MCKQNLGGMLWRRLLITALKKGSTHNRFMEFSVDLIFQAKVRLWDRLSL
jgi:hypothetical protein